MALVFRGSNSAFKRQVRPRGPTPDTTHGLFTLEETWQGKQSDLAAFLATRTLASAHGTYSELKLSEWEPTRIEAGMADVWLRYVGASVPGSGLTTGTKRFQSLFKSISAPVKKRRSFDRWASYTVGSAMSTADVSWGSVVQEVAAELTMTYYAPSITYRYASNALIKAARRSSDATTDLASVTPKILSENLRQTSDIWEMFSGFSTPSDITFLQSLPSGVTGPGSSQIRNYREEYVFDGDSPVGSPVTRATDMSCEPVGGSGWHNVEETWEVELA